MCKVTSCYKYSHKTASTIKTYWKKFLTNLLSLHGHETKARRSLSNYEIVVLWVAMSWNVFGQWFTRVKTQGSRSVMDLKLRLKLCTFYVKKYHCVHKEGVVWVVCQQQLWCVGCQALGTVKSVGHLYFSVQSQIAPTPDPTLSFLRGVRSVVSGMSAVEPSLWYLCNKTPFFKFWFKFKAIKTAATVKTSLKE